MTTFYCVPRPNCGNVTGKSGKQFTNTTGRFLIRLTYSSVLEQLEMGKQFSSRWYLRSWKFPYAHHPSLRFFPNVTFETVQLLIGLPVALSLPFKEDCRALPLSAGKYLTNTVLRLSIVLIP